MKKGNREEERQPITILTEGKLKMYLQSFSAGWLGGSLCITYLDQVTGANIDCNSEQPAFLAQPDREQIG